MRSLLIEFIDQKGWVEGPNDNHGKPIFVATGIGTTTALPTSPAFVGARINAYDKAMLNAKKEMIEYFGNEIKTSATLNYSEGKVGNLDDTGEDAELFDKVMVLAHAKLDELLEGAGVRNPEAAGKDLAEKAIASEEFKKFTTTLAQSFLAGMQSYKVIEEVTDKGESQVGVVAIYSERLADMAYAMARGTGMPKTTPKQPLREQIPADEKVLFTSFGAAQRIDENGNYVLVAFGQAAPQTPSTQSKLMAEEKARLHALGYLRSYAGEMVSAMSDFLAAETSHEFEDLTTSYEDEGAMRRRIEATATGLNIQGVETLRRWSTKHPVTGTDVFGVVLVWSPDRRAKAQSFLDSMKRDSRGRPLDTGQKPKNPAPGVSEGLESDPDAL